MVGSASSRFGDDVAEARAALVLLAEEFGAVLEDAYGLISLMRGLGELGEEAVPGFLAQADQVGAAVNEFRLRVRAFPHG